MTSSGKMHAEGQAKPKPKHVTTACISCRKKKIKCDGVTPKCSHCILYAQECIFQPTADKRRIHSKDRLAALEAHTQQLQSLLRANGIAVPAFNAAAPLSKSNNDSSGENGEVDDESQGSTIMVGSRSAMKNQNIEDRHDAEVETKPDSLVDQLSGRMGSLQIADDGQLRFYGPTSNLTILQNGPLSFGLSQRQSVSQNWQRVLDSSGLGQAVDPELEDHLLKLYFCWEDPSIHVVDEELYRREKQRCRQEKCSSPMYSEVLTNAICSVGASLTSRRCPALPAPLTEFFAARAKALLDLEMDSPTLSTVQSLVILSAVEALLTRDARGWLYSGMAVRLATDLGLHLEAKGYVEAGIINQEEARLRSTIFWGAFVHDRMWSIYVGRPVALEYKHVTLGLPMGGAPGVFQKFWQPYIDEHDGFRPLRLPDPAEDMARHNVLLCAKMQNIREVLYNDKKTRRNDLESIHTFVMEMSKELKDWHQNLPNTLVVDYHDTRSPYLPHVLQLHMQYHCIIILVNRPFLASAKNFPAMNTKDMTSSRDACSEAAASISRLLQIFDRLYTLRRMNVQAVHLIFTASVIHVYNACGTARPAIRDAAASDLEVCCHALREIGQQFKNAARALEVTIYLKAELLKRRRVDSKRPQPLSDRPQEETSSKRLRLSPYNESSFSVTQLPADSPIDDLDYLNHTGNDDVFGTSFEDNFQLDSLFWADFTTIELSNNGPWT